MKKVTTFAVVALFGALTFSSCKKNYTCTCTVKVTDTSGGVSTAVIDTTIKYDLGKQKKSDAKNACDNYQNQVNTVFGSNSANCGI